MSKETPSTTMEPSAAAPDSTEIGSIELQVPTAATSSTTSAASASTHTQKVVSIHFDDAPTTSPTNPSHASEFVISVPSPEHHAPRLPRQNTPKPTRKKKVSGTRFVTNQGADDEEEEEDEDEDTEVIVKGDDDENKSPSPTRTPPPSYEEPSGATTVSSPVKTAIVASSASTPPDGQPKMLLQRSVSDQTAVPVAQRKGVRFMPGSGGSNESDNKLGSPSSSTLHRRSDSLEESKEQHGMNGSSTQSDDIRDRGIPEDKHWIYRLLDPDDHDISFVHVNDHPEIWTDELINDVLTYIRPHDLTGILNKVLRLRNDIIEQNITISFRNLSYTDDDGKPRLQGVTGYLRPKMMMCILGGPDAGITTFLDVLASRQKGGQVTGELLCNGLPFNKTRTRALGYVTKEDINLPTLTVRETLVFSGALRSVHQRPGLLHLRIMIVLKFMGMLHCAETIVGNAQIRGISGGERRRLSYMCEILAGHACVIADLPTNGLDSASAYSLLSNIQRGCMAGRSMACSLVQPSPELFRLFSHVLVLSKGAQLYFGPANQVDLYFGHHGFKRPHGKEIPDFLEELSSTPGKFYVGQPPSVHDYLRLKDTGIEMVDIDSLQATADRDSKLPEYQWSLLTDEDERTFNCRKDDQVTHAVIDVSIKSHTHQPTGPKSNARILTASFRQDTPPDLMPQGSLSALGNGDSPAPKPPQQKKMRGLKNRFKSFAVEDYKTQDAFDVPFDVMDELIAEEKQLRHEIAQSIENEEERDHHADQLKFSHLMQRKWIWMVQCYRRSPIYEMIGKRMFTDMLQPQSEPIPYTEGQDTTAQKTKEFKYHSSFGRQLQYTTWRQWLITIRNPAFTVGALMRNIIMGLLIGSLFYMIGTTYQDARTRFGLFYFVMTFCSMGVVQMIPQLMEQRTVYYSQIASGYFNGIAYYLSFIVTSIPFAICEIFIFLIFVYPMSGLRNGVGGQQFFYTWLILFILNLTTRAWVLFIASISKNQTIAQALTPVSLVLMQLFCGYMVPLESIPNGWIWAYYLSPFTYTIKGLVINELYGLDFHCTGGVGELPYPSDPRFAAAPPLGFGNRTTCQLSNGHDVLSLYDMDVTDSMEKWFMMLWLVMFFIGFNILSATALLFVDHSSGDSSEVPNWSSDVRDHSASMQPELKKALAMPLPPTIPDGSVAVPIPTKRLGSRQSSIIAPEAYITFNNLCYTVTVPRKKGSVVPPGEDPKWEKRRLLTNCFGYATPKNMVALMGPSGAGKSTLLDVLANKKTGGEITGDILINGQPRDISFSHIAGYVEQFDSHDPFQTIREAIEFSALLRLDSSFTPERRKQRVEDVIEALNLGHVQHHLIGSEETGGISPELRKKTTIAVELVMAPSLLFLDEPTTGLDSAGALAVMHAVSRLAQNISVICTIHQPSTEIVSLFNSILLLKSFGEIAYFGPILKNPNVPNSRGVIEFFEDPELFKDYIESRHPPPFLVEKNRADFSLETIRNMALDLKEDGTVRTNPAEVFLTTPEAKAIKQQLAEGSIGSSDSSKFRKYTHAEATNGIEQFVQLLRRDIKSRFRNKPVWRSRFFVPTFISLLLGTLYFQLGFTQFAVQNRISLCYLIVIIVSFSAASILPGIFNFRPVFFRETQSHMYSAGPYWAARILGDIPYIIVEVMLYSLILYWIAGLTAVDTGGRWGFYILAIFGARFAALGFCEGVARLVPDIAAATAVISLLNTIMMLFVGFLIQKKSIPAGWSWMYYVSFFRYPLSFLCANELRDETFYCTTNELKYVPTSAAPTDPYHCTGDTDPYCLPVCPLTHGTQILDQFSIGYSESDRATNLGVIFVFVGGFQIINLLAIKYVNHVKR